MIYILFKKKSILEKNFLFPKSYSLEDKNQRDEIIKDHLGLGASKNKNKIRTIFVVDFLFLIPYSVGAYTSFFLKKLKNIFLKELCLSKIFISPTFALSNHHFDQLTKLYYL